MNVIVAWSGGKDSALALYTVLTGCRYNVLGLLTTFTEDYNRVTMHGVRRSLVLDQAEALDLPLYEVFIPKGCSIDVYEERMSRAMSNLKQIGVEGVVFGDIYLEDVRRYREENLAKIGVKAIFPLWGWDPYLTARRFIELGFKAVVVCVDSRILDESFTGRLFDQSFLENLSGDIDPCGERGEFHTFVFDGPIFRRRVNFKIGEIVLRDGFYYCDLIPLSDSQARTISQP